jgi:hypothetical protein
MTCTALLFNSLWSKRAKPEFTSLWPGSFPPTRNQGSHGVSGFLESVKKEPSFRPLEQNQQMHRAACCGGDDLVLDNVGQKAVGFTYGIVAVRPPSQLRLLFSLLCPLSLTLPPLSPSPLFLYFPFVSVYLLCFCCLHPFTLSIPLSFVLCCVCVLWLWVSAKKKVFFKASK